MGGPAFYITGDGRQAIAEADNFFEVPFEVDGVGFVSSEAAYQAMKCFDARTGEIRPENQTAFDRLQNCADGNEAWSLGQEVVCRSDWDSLRVAAMLHVNRAKLVGCPSLVQGLDGSEDAYLFVPYTFRFWGTPGDTAMGQSGLVDGRQVSALDPRLEDQNWNGRIQMILRESWRRDAGQPVDWNLLVMLLTDVVALFEVGSDRSGERPDPRGWIQQVRAELEHAEQQFPG